jgi:hypothetical protein
LTPMLFSDSLSQLSHRLDFMFNVPALTPAVVSSFALPGTWNSES